MKVTFAAGLLARLTAGAARDGRARAREEASAGNLHAVSAHAGAISGAVAVAIVGLALSAGQAGAGDAGKARKVLACKDLPGIAKRLATGEGANPVEEQDGQDPPASGQPGQDRLAPGGAGEADAGQADATRGDADDEDVIEAEGPVTATDPNAVPPYLVLCDGAPRLACIMETPLPDASLGRTVHLLGRLTEGDNRMLVIDPCGATIGR